VASRRWRRRDAASPRRRRHDRPRVHAIDATQVNALKKVPWRFLIIDEAHRIKNERAQLSKTVRLLKTENRLLVTGTPLQNNLHELWALLNFLLPDVFASAERFDELFNLQSSDRDKTQMLVEQLHRLLRPFMIRRLKADVEKDLPRKTETILFTSLAPIQRDVYKQCLLREISTVQGSAAAKSRGPLLNLVMQLRKCCNHPYLFPHVEDRSLPALGEHLIDSCGKLKVLDKLLARLKERNHRVLVFSQMTRMLDVLEDFLVMRCRAASVDLLSRRVDGVLGGAGRGCRFGPPVASMASSRDHVASTRLTRPAEGLRVRRWRLRETTPTQGPPLRPRRRLHAPRVARRAHRAVQRSL